MTITSIYNFFIVFFSMICGLYLIILIIGPPPSGDKTGGLIYLELEAPFVIARRVGDGIGVGGIGGTA